MDEKLIVGIILMVVGIIFFLNNKNIGKGVYKFYQKMYTEKNLIILFKIFGIFLIIAGILIGFFG